MMPPQPFSPQFSTIREFLSQSPAVRGVFYLHNRRPGQRILFPVSFCLFSIAGYFRRADIFPCYSLINREFLKKQACFKEGSTGKPSVPIQSRYKLTGKITVNLKIRMSCSRSLRHTIQNDIRG